MYRAEFDADAVRVERLFRAAPARGVPYLRASLTLADLARLLGTGRVVLLLLLDVRTLRPLTASFLLPYARYVGHYVAVCGHDPESRQFAYLDPAQPAGECAVGWPFLVRRARAALIMAGRKG